VLINILSYLETNYQKGVIIVANNEKQELIESFFNLLLLVTNDILEIISPDDYLRQEGTTYEDLISIAAGIIDLANETPKKGKQLKKFITIFEKLSQTITPLELITCFNKMAEKEQRFHSEFYYEWYIFDIIKEYLSLNNRDNEAINLFQERVKQAIYEQKEKDWKTSTTTYEFVMGKDRIENILKEKGIDPNSEVVFTTHFEKMSDIVCKELQRQYQEETGKKADNETIASVVVQALCGLLCRDLVSKKKHK
jgi:hypothetical protein